MPRFDFTSQIPSNLVELDGIRYRNLGMFIYISVNQPSSGPSPAPVVSNVAPPSGAIDPSQILELDITDESDSFRRIILVVEFPDLKIKEVVFDGEGFGPMYSELNNTQSDIGLGYHFTLRRDGGWPQGPIILTPFAIDTTGSENS